MKIKRLSWLAILSALTLAGCILVPATIRPDAFGASKRYAIVTVAALEEIGAGSKPLSEILGDKNPARNSQTLLNVVKPMIFKRFAESPHFKLLPERRVLGHKAYKGMEADPARMLTVDYHTAKGYKFFKDKQKLAALAQGLGVDGVFVVGVAFGVTRQNNIAFADISLSAVAYDRNGQTVWRDMVFIRSDKSVTVHNGAVAIEKLYPLLIQATRRAAGAAMAKLDEKLASGRSGFHLDPERHR